MKNLSGFSICFKRSQILVDWGPGLRWKWLPTLRCGLGEGGWIAHWLGILVERVGYDEADVSIKWFRLKVHRRNDMYEGPIGKQLMIKQGYVPATCTLPDQLAGPLIYSEVSKGISPCAGCNADRRVCHGKPRDENYGRAPKPV